MFRIVGAQVRKQFELDIDVNEMKLVAIRSDFVQQKKEQEARIETRGDAQYTNVDQ